MSEESTVGGTTANDNRGFKGLKQAIKLEFQLGRYSDVSANGVEGDRKLY